MAKPKQKLPLASPPPGAFNNPFAKLQGTPVAATAPTTVPNTAPPAVPGRSDALRQKRILVRHERKGHGGKTVTLVTGVTLPAPQLELFVKELRQALGCGAQGDAECITVQGDQRERIAQFFLQKHAITVRQG